MNLFLRGLLVSIGLIILWFAIVKLGRLPSYILPSPIEVATTWYHHIHLIATEAWPTILETLLGLLFGTLVGILTALLMALFQPLRFWLLPILVVSQAVPTFAIAPLLVIWFGYGMASKIITTMIMLFFPITSAFFDGLRQTNIQWLELSKTMQASRWRTFWYIRIPSALPHLASGLRVATVIAPIGAVVGEWVGASRGLGYLMLNANARLQIDLMFAALLTLIILSLLLYFLVDKTLQILVFWQSRN